MTDKRRRPDISQQELKEFYNRPGETISSAADHFSTSRKRIRDYLKKYDIIAKTHKQASAESNKRKRQSFPDRNVLLELYKTNSIKTLEKIFGVGQETIYLWLKQLDIPIKTPSDAYKTGWNNKFISNIPEKEELELKYKELGSLLALQKYYNVSRITVNKWFEYYQLEVIFCTKSSAEITLGNYIEQFCEIERSNKSLIKPYELDIVCNNEPKIAIEYCGLYWHSEGTGKKDKKYHQEKYIKCKNQNIELLTFFDTDRNDIIKSIIRTKLGMNNRIFARNCIVKKITSKQSNDFMLMYHLSGSHNATVHYGLFYNNELLQVMTFSKSRFNKKYEWEIIRSATKAGITVVGGASKLFSKFRNDCSPTSVITYSDLRIGEGKSYEKIGFEFSHMTLPNYWYFKRVQPNKLYSRIQYQKHKLKNKLNIYNPLLTEYANMYLNGYDRIWDCGNNVYIWKK